MDQLIDSIAVTPAKPGTTERPGCRRLGRWARRASVVAASLLGIAASLLGVAALAGAAGASIPYRFRTLDNGKDLTFNQLLGINQQGVIAGYFGSGAQRHPNKAYLLFPKYGRGAI